MKGKNTPPPALREKAIPGRIELSIKYGMRDALTSSVGRRWMVSYWSRQALSKVLTQPCRIVLFAAASFAALRLEQLIDDDPRWMASALA